MPSRWYFCNDEDDYDDDGDDVDEKVDVDEEDDVREGNNGDNLILFRKLSHRQIPSIAPPYKATHLISIIMLLPCQMWTTAYFLPFWSIFSNFLCKFLKSKYVSGRKEITNVKYAS